MRQANFELLRLIAIILIVVLHADFFALDAPDNHRLLSSPIISVSQLLIESIAICSVNVFILISGWFGLRPKVKSISNLCFQILYFTIGIYIVTLLLGVRTIDFEGLKSIIFLSNNGWFIRSYILLLILAPILNKYIEYAEKKHIEIILVTFILFQTIYGWLFDVAKFFCNGYSTTSFIWLYLFARYLRLHAPNFSRLKLKCDAIIFILSIITLTLLAIIPAYADNTYRMSQLYAYNNPIIIIMSTYLFLYFSKINFNSKIIINIASSSFAIYLLHCNPNIMNNYFVAPIKQIYDTYFGFECLSYIALIVTIYVIGAIILDIPRKYIWNKYLLPRFK